MQGFYEGNTFERKRLGRLVEPLDHEARMTLDEGEGKEGQVEIVSIAVESEKRSAVLSGSLRIKGGHQKGLMTSRYRPASVLLVHSVTGWEHQGMCGLCTNTAVVSRAQQLGPGSVKFPIAWRSAKHIVMAITPQKAKIFIINVYSTSSE